MNFLVTILGSGAATPKLGRYCSAQVVNMDGFKMLVDCGESTQNQIRHYRQKMQSFGTIFISHLHGDHIFGLPGLLSTMHLGGRKEPVDIFSPKGLKEALTPLFELSGSDFDFEIKYHEIENDEPVAKEIFHNNHCTVKAFPLYHSIPCFGFIFEEYMPYFQLKQGVAQQYNMSSADIRMVKQGRDYTTEEGIVIPNNELVLPKREPIRYAYCCDTSYNDSLVDIVRGVDLLCVEGTFDKSMEQRALETGHCTTRQAAQLARNAQCGNLLLTHFSARYRDLQPLYDDALEVFPRTLMAEDGLALDLDVLAKYHRNA